MANYTAFQHPLIVGQNQAITSIVSTGNLSVYGTFYSGNLTVSSYGVMISNNSAGTATYSLSVAIYSLTGSTLSLYDSGSATTTLSQSVSAKWLSLPSASSVTLTSGIWYIGIIFAGSTASNPTVACAFRDDVVSAGDYSVGTAFVKGTATNTSFPVSIGTNAFTTTNMNVSQEAYIVIGS